MLLYFSFVLDIDGIREIFRTPPRKSTGVGEAG